jgi:hypothetical protein
MRKNTVTSKCSTIHFQPRPYGSAILSRKGRKLWAGVLTHVDETLRMRGESPSGSYETLPVEPAEAQSWDSGDAASGRFEVKPHPQTAE